MARKSRSRKRKPNPGSNARAASASVVGEESCNYPDLGDSTSEQKLKDGDCQNEATIADSVVIRAVESNTALLEQLLTQVNDLQSTVAERPNDVESAPPESEATTAGADEIEQLHNEIFDLRAQVDELEQQNNDLASQVANANIRDSVSTADSSCNDALSWEERKELILSQMEDDSFDAASFIEDLQDEADQSSGEPLDPAGYVEQLNAELARRDAELKRRDQEIGELQCLLQHQSETRDGGVAIGAAAIAQMVDADELVHEERERLQLLQAEWEEKFRQGEIEASLERAKLSRERQELAKKTAELEEQLEHHRRESRHATEGGGPGSSRRWLVKLGLADDTDE